MTLRFDDEKVPYIDLGYDVRVALELDEYSDEKSIEKARQELRESPKIVESSLQELRDLLKCDKDLNIPINDDAFLVKFLRPRKYYAKSAYELIKGYYKMKAKTDFILNNISASSIRVALEERVVQLLPKRDQHGRRIIYLEMGAKWDSSKVPYPELVRATNVLAELITLEPKTQLNGCIFIVNFDKLSFSHLVQFKPKFVKNVLEFGQKYAPVRVKSIHLVNNAKLFNVVLQIFKPFMGQKWGQRIHLHGADMGALHNQVNPDCLPLKLGGSAEIAEYEGKALLQFVEHYQEKFDELNSYGYKEEVL